MKIKQLIRLSIFTFSALLISCNSEDTLSTLSTDAEISSFTLAENDNVMSNLDLVFFTIDQKNDKIYNADSLPVGTIFQKLLAKISFISASKAIIRYQSGDTLNYNSTDSIDFTNPFQLEVLAYDGKTSKTYEVKLNVHQQEPDSMQWNLLQSPIWDLNYNKSKTVQFNNKFLSFFETTSSYQLFGSSDNDGKTWSQETLTGFPENALIYSIIKFKNALYLTTADNQLFSSTDGQNWATVSSIETGFVTPIGVVKDHLGNERLIVERVNNNTYYLAYTLDGTIFTTCGDASLPADFPVKEFATILTPASISNKLSVIGGVSSDNEIRSTIHQMYFDKYGFHIGYNINNNNIAGYSGFAKRKGAIAYYYDNRMIVSGGSTNDTTYNDFFTSIDNGVSWQRQDSLISFPQNFSPRANASTIVDSNNMVWIFGGIGEGGENLNEVWKGRINRLGFQNKQ